MTIKEDKHHDYGSLTLAGIFEHSSNIGIIRVGLRLGAQRLFDGASALGVGQPTGVDLPGENPGILRPLARCLSSDGMPDVDAWLARLPSEPRARARAVLGFSNDDRATERKNKGGGE